MYYFELINLIFLLNPIRLPLLILKLSIIYIIFANHQPDHLPFQTGSFA